MNKRHYEHTLPNIRGSLSNTYFWTKVKKRSNTEVLDNYMALMKKQGLKILDSAIPDLCRYDKELSSRTRTYFRCSLLPPPAGQLKGSGLQELANELIVKFNL